MDTSGRQEQQPTGSARQRQPEGNAPSDSLKGSFVDKLAPMMYGFGDDIEPLPETVDLVESIVIEYASGLLRMAVDRAAARGRVKPAARGPPGAVATAEDIVMLVRKDPRKFARVKELLELAPLLKKAAMVDTEEEDLVKYLE